MDCLATLADVAQQAERDHAMVEATSSRLVIRSTSGVSFHSVAARHGVGGAGCARPLARPRAARHHIRRDARVWAQPKWISIALVAQQAEQPPCKRQAARSNRRRGHHQSSRVRLDGRGHHSFKVDTRVRIPHATPAQGTLVELTLRGGNRPQRLGGAGTRDRMDFSGGVAQHPVEQPPCKRQAAGSNPVTSTTNQRLVNSVARVPACLAGSRGFDSRTRRQRSLPR